VKALPLLLCLALAACADLETKLWFRVDGNPSSPEQLDLDKTTCRQEMQRSVQATTQAAGLDRNIVRSDVYETCMARLGYSDKSNQRFTAPTPAAVRGSQPPPVRGGNPPPAVPSSTVPPPVQASPPASSDQQCRKPTDLRMWLPLCP
jgi:hypothetical protein